MGYHRAGFDVVVGVDNRPQPRYPFEFHQADAMTFPLDGFDAIHASPPCQDHSPLSALVGEHGTGWLLSATRGRLYASGRPWVIENVDGADMPGALTLCGTEFGLYANSRYLRRHRQFEANFPLWGAGGCSCQRARIGGVYGNGGGGSMTRGFKFSKSEAATAMGIDWMTQAELSQAIPPAYTQFIGEQLLAHLKLSV